MGNCLKGITESSLLEPLIGDDTNFEEEVLEKLRKLDTELENTKANVIILETNTYKNLQLISEDLNYINEKINEQSGELSPIIQEKSNNTQGKNNEQENDLENVEEMNESNIRKSAKLQQLKSSNDFFLSTQSINE